MLTEVNLSLNDEKDEKCLAYIEEKYPRLLKYFTKIHKMNRLDFERFCNICE
jgi:hypothetical protein